MPTSNEKQGKIRIVVADDNKFMRDKIVQFVDSEFEVVGTAEDGNAALETVLQLEPDIVLLDISMPGITGIDAASEIKKKLPAKIIMLTVHEDPDYIRAALNAGASGYVLKSEMVTDLKDALRAVSEGNVFISPNCAFNND
jgi:DNA-binding NarL/FixJ family response regulator